MIIVPLDQSFDYKPSGEQNEAIEELQLRSNQAGLRGSVVAVWQSGGRMKFIAPRQWHPFFRSISLNFVIANLNRQLSW